MQATANSASVCAPVHSGSQTQEMMMEFHMSLPIASAASIHQLGAAAAFGALLLDDEAGTNGGSSTRSTVGSHPALGRAAAGFRLSHPAARVAQQTPRRASECAGHLKDVSVVAAMLSTVAQRQKNIDDRQCHRTSRPQHGGSAGRSSAPRARSQLRGERHRRHTLL